MINKKTTIKQLIALGVSAVIFTILTVLSAIPSVCEFFATTFARAWIFVFGNVFGILPFSMYELFLIAAIVLAVVFIVYIIVFLSKRQWNRLLSMVLITAITVFSFLNIYTATATMSYNRAPLPSYVYAEYSSNDLSYSDALALASGVIDDVNSAYEQTEHDSDGNIVYPFSFSELSDLLREEYKRLDNKYFSSFTPKGKRIINKTIMSELGIVGVFFAPFGEANINGYENNLFLPHTLAHEMAHSKGVMREYQADIVASYILLTSTNPYLRYGALVKCMYYALSILSSFPDSKTDYAELSARINSKISTERSNYAKFYGQFHHLDDLGEFFNDLYLKLQKQPDGTNSYTKPGEIVDTGDKDSSGDPIVFVVNFSGTQNLLINLYKQKLLWHETSR